MKLHQIKKLRESQQRYNNDKSQSQLNLGQSLAKMAEAIEHISFKLDNIDYGQTMKNSQNIPTDQRFKYVNFSIPSLSSCHNRFDQLAEFIGSLSKKVFQHGFTLLKQQEVTSDQLKVYCSQNILYSVLKLVQKNNLIYSDLSYINRCLKQQILPYYSAKYPLSQAKQSNNTLESIINAKDNIGAEENDLIHSFSEIAFKYKESGNYNQQIMQVFNKIITESKKHQQEFQNEMKELFQTIESEEKVLLMEAYNNPDGIFKKDSVEKNIKGALEDNLFNEQKKAKYRENVKQYTNYRIGKKLSDSIKEFTQADIETGNLQLGNPSLKRVALKWCEELEKYFDPENILKREKPFFMRNRQLKFLQNSWQYQLLSKLLERHAKEPREYLQQILQHGNHSQAEFGKQRQSKGLLVFSREESMIGNFAAKIYKMNESYLKGYINKLIHGILKALADFQRIIQRNRDGGLSLSEDNVSKLISLAGIPDKNVEEIIPDLITFKIGDLLRCKCDSKEREIVTLYRMLEWKNYMQKGFKIVRVKNRLNKGTRDILINILYQNAILVQIQLAIKSDKSKFIENSSKFSHFFYELQRAQFGPINEMCSIWISKDDRSKFYINHVDSKNTRQPNHQICNHKYSQKNDHPTRQVNLPYKCGNCHYFYYNPSQHISQKKCELCQNNVCFLCQFEVQSEQEKYKFFELEAPSIFQNQLIYEQGQKMQNIHELISQVGHIRMTKNIVQESIKYYKYEQKRFVFLFDADMIDNNFKLKPLIILSKETKPNKYVTQQDSIANRNETRKILTENIIICSHQALRQKQQNIRELVISSELVQSGEKHSIFIVKQNVSNRVFDHYVKTATTDLPNVKFLNLSENKLKNIDALTYLFQSVQSVVLSANQITLLSPTINKWTHLRYLNLKYNIIYQLPDQFYSLKNLQEFDLSHNQITELSPKIKELKGLKIIHIKINCLKQLPEQIGDLKDLEYLDISSNKLKKLPFRICQLHCLEHLDILRNLIESIPVEIHTLATLKVFKAYSNKILSLPAGFGDLSNIVQLGLENNCIQELPQQFGGLTKLTKMNISANKLSSLPQKFGNLSSLTSFYLNQNIFQKLPDCIGHLHSLITLSIQKNFLSSLPDSIGQLHKLNSLTLRSNKLSTLPATIGGLASLKRLDLSENCLVQLPSSIGSLANLIYLNLVQNKLEQIPTSIRYLTKISYLQIFMNPLKILPVQLKELTKLSQLYLTEDQAAAVPDELLQQQKILIYTEDDQSITIKQYRQNKSKLN